MPPAGRNVKRPVGCDRQARTGVVVDRLPESHAEGEDEDDHEHPDAPPDRLLTAPDSAAFVPFDRREGPHGV